VDRTPGQIKTTGKKISKFVSNTSNVKGSQSKVSLLAQFPQGAEEKG
jgi:hypothetical protein